MQIPPKSLPKKRVFSGIQPSGTLHLGNYLGAIRQWTEMQDEYDCIFCVVDYHAITVRQNPAELKKKIIDVAKAYIAAGIDPDKSVIFQQSDVNAHTELAWILNCITNTGELKRMTQFKDRTGIWDIETQQNKTKAYFKKIIDEFENTFNKNDSTEACHKKSKIQLIKLFGYLETLLNQENKKFNLSTVGLFGYPVLMAADILLYNTDVVPVGEDQKQHVELTRDLARRFNACFGETFRVPEVKIVKAGARVMGLDDPAKKMSKSAKSEYSYISLTDAPDKAAQKIMRAATDSGKEIKYDPEKKPGISNLLAIYSLLTRRDINDLEKQYAGRGYGDFKKDLAEATQSFLMHFQYKLKNISDKEVADILDIGADKIRPLAEKTLKKVKEKIGVN